MRQEEEIIKISHADYIELVLNRPHKKNALTFKMYEILTEALEEAKKTDAIKLVILRANGDDFCTGNDISDFLKINSIDISNVNIFELPVFRFLKSLTFFNKPIILELKGLCVGIGATILLHCDYIVSEKSTKLMFPFVKMGLVAEAAFTILMPLKIGYLKSIDLLTREGFIQAEEALGLGLINQVVENNEAVLNEVIERFVNIPSKAFSENKILMRNPDQLWNRIVQEGQIFLDLLKSKDFQSYANNFLTK